MGKSRFFILFFLILGCTGKDVGSAKNNPASKTPWHHTDPVQDGIPGISLQRAYNEGLITNDSGPVIVAVLDSGTDIFHEDLSESIHQNMSEVPHNGMDDDGNGYVDDVYGWNFLGTGEYDTQSISSFDHTRTIKKYRSDFEGKTIRDIPVEKHALFENYQRAVALMGESNATADYLLREIPKYKAQYYDIRETFLDKITGPTPTLEEINRINPNDGHEEHLVSEMKFNLQAGLDLEYLLEEEKKQLLHKYTCNNIHYDERKDIRGNNNIRALKDNPHGTQVAGVIAGRRDNGIGVQGVSNNIKIMSLLTMPYYGEEHDTDISNAIRYAVDNGAKVINFSNGKPMATDEELLFDALKYAESKGVLFVTSAGNSGENSDIRGFDQYPMAYNRVGDTLSNFINVGSTSKSWDRILMVNTNYGKATVDIMAPGDSIVVVDAGEKMYTDNISGTSLASALTSGVAALIMSEYPTLSAKEVKLAIMEGGTEYGGYAKVGRKDSIPFSDLSRSGRILNVYRSLLLADSLANTKTNVK